MFAGIFGKTLWPKPRRFDPFDSGIAGYLFNVSLRIIQIDNLDENALLPSRKAGLCPLRAVLNRVSWLSEGHSDFQALSGCRYPIVLPAKAGIQAFLLDSRHKHAGMTVGIHWFLKDVQEDTSDPCTMQVKTS